AMRAPQGDDAVDEQSPASQTSADEREEKTVEFESWSWPVLRTQDAVHARGMANVRRALVEDTTYDWNSPPAADPPNWRYALEFNDGRNWATVLFDPDSRRVALTNRRRIAVVEPSANGELREFFAEQFPDEPRDEASEKPSDAK
ncbi:MAG TPA: hypothetical protein VGX76_23345, partial [Pirellulales bacterium]|nr:hypothetical protein [Pirellulales bacterium]